MFVYSVRASTVRFFTVIGLVLVLLVVMVTVGDGAAVYASGDGVINYDGMKTNEDRIAFIESFGIKVNPEAKEEKSFTMPEDFDRVILGYNELQKKQGLDISKYAKKKVTRYTYEVTNYKDGSAVSVNLLIYRSRIIAADMSKSGEGGFVLPLCDVTAEMLFENKNQKTCKIPISAPATEQVRDFIRYINSNQKVK